MKKNHKKKEQLLIDKKECSNCGHILEKDTKVCNECGYDMTMEEAFKIYSNKVRKFLNEQTAAPTSINLKKPTGKFTKQSVEVPVDPKTLKPGVYQLNVSADEGKKKKRNPWAICTASVGREDKEKYEKCVMDVKKQYKLDEDLQRLEEYIERLIMDSEVNPKIKKGNFKQFVSKLK
jgi:ribosomal protein L37E